MILSDSVALEPFPIRLSDPWSVFVDRLYQTSPSSAKISWWKIFLSMMIIIWHWIRMFLPIPDQRANSAIVGGNIAYYWSDLQVQCMQCLSTDSPAGPMSAYRLICSALRVLWNSHFWLSSRQTRFRTDGAESACTDCLDVLDTNGCFVHLLHFRHTRWLILFKGWSFYQCTGINRCRQ